MQQGGGGQGGQQGGEQPLIPPAQELKLLRDLQVQLADETRDISVDPGADRERVVGGRHDAAGAARARGDLAQRVSSSRAAPGACPQCPRTRDPITIDQSPRMGRFTRTGTETGRGRNRHPMRTTPTGRTAEHHDESHTILLPLHRRDRARVRDARARAGRAEGAREAPEKQGEKAAEDDERRRPRRKRTPSLDELLGLPDSSDDARNARGRGRRAGGGHHEEAARRGAGRRGGHPDEFSSR